MRGVRQGEDDRSRSLRGHTADDGIGESAFDGGEAHECRGLHILDDVEQVRHGRARVVLSGEDW